MRRVSIFLIVALFGTALARLAQAQVHTGPFQSMTSWYSGPQTGSNGTSPFFPSATQITIDTNGNGLLDPPNDLAFPMPSAHASGSGTWNFRLSPSRRHLYVFGVPNPNLSCPGGTVVAAYRIPATAGSALIPLGGSRCIPTRIAMDRFFDQDGASQSILCIVGNPSPAGSNTQAVHWLDLNTGTWATSFPELSRSVVEVAASPTGMAAFLQHDADGDALADYSGVCLMSGHLGEVFNIGGSPLSQLGQPLAVASIVDVAGQLTMRVHWPDASTIRTDIPLTTCAPSPPPPPSTGACCLPNGGCAGGLTASECSQLAGTWHGANTVCATAACPPPPAPLLGVTLTGPATVQRPKSITWTIGWSNTGTLAASSVTVVDVLPANVTFASATNGGVFDAFTGEVRFTLPTLGIGASNSATITALTSCNFAASVTNSAFSIRDAVLPPTAGAPPVVTTLTAPPADPVTVSSASTALSAQPLADAGQIEHTITLTEAAGVAREEVRVQFTPGPETGLGAVVDSAGGTVRPGFGASFVWAVPLPANGTRTLRFRTVVSSCRTGDVASTTLNNGSFLIASNVCDTFLGIGSPGATIALGGPSVSVELFPLAGTQAAGFQKTRAAGVRPGGPLEFEVRIRNSTVTSKSVESMTLPVPLGFTCADPPFIGAPPAGANWDAPSQTLSWAGTLAANQLVTIPIRAVLGSAGGGQEMTAQLRLQGCAVGPSAKLFAVAVAQPPAGSHVLQLTSHGVLFAVVTAAGAIPQLVLECPPGMVSFTGGITRLPNGDLWIAGQPTLRVNLTTLDFEYFADLRMKLDLDTMDDVAWDPVDSSLVFCGYKLTNRLGVRRWRRNTDVVTPLYTATPGSTWTGARHIVVGSDRAVACETSVGLVRIPFAGAPVIFDQPGTVADPSGLAIDNDGNYVVADGTGNSGPKRLAKIDRTTGAFTIIADTDVLLPTGSFWSALAVAPDADVFLGTSDAGLAVLHRPTLVGGGITPPAPPLRLTDIVHGGGPGNVDAPAPARVSQVLDFAAPFPNPSRLGSAFRFTLPAAGLVRLAILDVTGRERVRLANGWREAGAHDLNWDGRCGDGRLLAPGLYFVRLESARGQLTRKLVVAR